MYALQSPCFAELSEPLDHRRVVLGLSDQSEIAVSLPQAAIAPTAPAADQTNDCVQVAETCQLALQRIQYLTEHPDCTNEESPYYSVDPVPALPASTPTPELKALLLDESRRMFDVSVACACARHMHGGRVAE